MTTVICVKIFYDLYAFLWLLFSSLMSYCFTFLFCLIMVYISARFNAVILCAFSYRADPISEIKRDGIKDGKVHRNSE